MNACQGGSWDWRDYFGNPPGKQQNGQGWESQLSCLPCSAGPLRQRRVQTLGAPYERLRPPWALAAACDGTAESEGAATSGGPVRFCHSAVPLWTRSPTLSRAGGESRAGPGTCDARDFAPAPTGRRRPARAPHPATRRVDPPDAAGATGRCGSRARGRGRGRARRPAVRRGPAARAPAARRPGPAAGACRFRRPPGPGPSGALRRRAGRIALAAARRLGPPPGAPSPPARRQRTHGPGGQGRGALRGLLRPARSPSSCSGPPFPARPRRREELGSSARNFEPPPPGPALVLSMPGRRRGVQPEELSEDSPGSFGFSGRNLGGGPQPRGRVFLG